MTVRIIYYKKYNSFAIREKILEPNDGVPSQDRHYSYDILWKKYTPKFEKIMNNGKKNVFLSSEIMSMNYEVENLDTAKTCLIMMIFEDIT